MSLKEHIANDRKLFLNDAEFADTITINGTALAVLVDNDRLSIRQQTEYDGLIVGDVLYFVDSSAFTKVPKPGDAQTFSGKSYTVVDVKLNKGIYEIILKGAGVF